jgi:hypothetical protein
MMERCTGLDATRLCSPCWIQDSGVELQAAATCGQDAGGTNEQWHLPSRRQCRVHGACRRATLHLHAALAGGKAYPMTAADELRRGDVHPTPSSSSLPLFDSAYRAHLSIIEQPSRRRHPLLLLAMSPVGGGRDCGGSSKTLFSCSAGEERPLEGGRLTIASSYSLPASGGGRAAR